MFAWLSGGVPSNANTSGVYRQWDYGSLVSVLATLVTGNRAGASGGGIAIGNGGNVTVSDSNVTANTAGVFGGGVVVTSVCSALAFHGSCLLSGNKAGAGGEQLASFSGGPLDLGGVTARLSSPKSQLLLPSGGQVTLSSASSFLCPVGSLFQDTYGARYGPNATGMYLDGWPSPMEGAPVSVAMALFVCQPCPAGQYTLGSGVSSGVPFAQVNPPCRPCPRGGSCVTGAKLVASPGYWGAPTPDGSVAFLQCPLGYCCGSGNTTCVGISGCAGNRTGRLCGACAPGFGEAFGTSVCRAAGECGDGGWVWLLLVLCVCADAAVMLHTAGVWRTANTRSRGFVKLTSYFFQVRYGHEAGWAHLCGLLVCSSVRRRALLCMFA